MRTEMSTERTLGHQLDGSPELLRELLFQFEPPEPKWGSVLWGTKRHEDVNVTLRSGLPPSLRAKELDARGVGPKRSHEGLPERLPNGQFSRGIGHDRSGAVGGRCEHVNVFRKRLGEGKRFAR